MVRRLIERVDIGPDDIVATFKTGAGEAVELPSAESARRRTQALSLKHTGAVAFSRTGDPATGEFGDAEIIVAIGDVDLTALQPKAPEAVVEPPETTELPFGKSGKPAAKEKRKRS